MRKQGILPAPHLAPREESPAPLAAVVSPATFQTRFHRPRLLSDLHRMTQLHQISAPPGRLHEATVEATHVVVETRERRLVNLRGEPLAPGCALELGFYSRGTMATPFRGRWMPLCGPFTADTNRSVPYPRIGNGDLGPGRLSWSHTFAQGLEALAPVRTPLALRLFDHADPQAARHYNTVSNPSWWCRAPKAGTPALVFMSLDFEGLLWEGGARDAYKTSLPVFGSMFTRLMALRNTLDEDEEM